jgi:hypothetical protein
MTTRTRYVYAGHLLAVPLVVALVLVAAVPGPCHPARPAGDDDGTAVDLLGRATDAASTTGYHGVQQVTTWLDGKRVAQVMTIHHVPGRGTYVSEHGRPGVLSPERVDAGSSALLLGILTATYQVYRAGRARVAGRAADVVGVRDRQGAVVARYWLDHGAGIILRRDVFGVGGRPASSSVLRHVVLDAGRTHAAPAAAARSVQLGRVVPLDRLGRLHADGWTVPGQLAGVLSLYDARVTGTGADPVLHLSYSDGVSTLSVFEQRGHLDEGRVDDWDRSRRAGRTVYVRDTVPRQIMWSASDTVFTVVADAPDTTVDDSVRALPHAQQSGPGFWERLARGFGRIVSWCNPF